MATRVTAATVLPNWQAVDDSLKEIGQIDRRVEVHTSKANTAIEKFRQTLADATRDDQARKLRLETDVRAYTEANAGEFDGRRKVLNFGTVMLRTTSALKPLSKWTLAMVLERLKERKRKEFVRVKEEVDKEKIDAAKLNVEQLQDLGLRVVTEDSFSYELAEIEAQPT